MEYKKNQIVTVTIEDMGNDGEGIGKVDGFSLFVKDAVIGDKVEARITKVKKSYAYARLENLLVPSPFRVKPKCAVHRQCGGCQIQALSYEKQLEFKQKKVSGNLIRIGGFPEMLIDAIMEPMIGMENPYRYRNKAQFPIGYDRENNLTTGFYAGRTHNIISNTDCVLGISENKEILETILYYMKEKHISAYDEVSGQGLVRHVLIRKGFSSGELMVCIIINAKNLKDGKNQDFWEELVDALSKISNMTSVSINYNREKTNVILGQEGKVLWGKPYITDTIGSVTFRISPLSFYQINPVQTEKLYGLALEYAELKGTETVWDLYCGIGTISLFLAGKARQVYGVEVVPQAIFDARENARLNGIKNAEFYVGKAEEVLPEKYGKEGIYADVIVVDPPRKGCDEKCLETMLKMCPEKIVYVSCDSATLARDLKVLCEGGYELKKVRGVDMFPGTGHVETVVLLSHKLPDSTINVKVEFGEGEGKVLLEAIAERAKKYQPKPKITYKMIQEYVEKKYGFKVHTAYIAEVKRSLGLTMYDAPNTVEELKHPRKCPPKEKTEAITDALKYFEVI